MCCAASIEVGALFGSVVGVFVVPLYVLVGVAVGVLVGSISNIAQLLLSQ